jgi:hypothetical protein
VQRNPPSGGAVVFGTPPRATTAVTAPFSFGAPNTGATFGQATASFGFGSPGTSTHGTFGTPLPAAQPPSLFGAQPASSFGGQQASFSFGSSSSALPSKPTSIAGAYVRTTLSNDRLGAVTVKTADKDTSAVTTTVSIVE